MKKYDYIIVGSGLYGAIFAYEAKKRGKNVLVLEKRSHIGGNLYTKEVEGINVHVYGAHIFHTSNKKVWDYVNQFTEFNNYVNSPIANYKGEIYNLPFNMNTFSKLWGVITPEEASKKIEEQRSGMFTKEPKNLEEQAINLVGIDIYEKLIKGYTEKQWGRKCTELPPFIIKRLPVRFTYNNNYFNDRYQGIPIGGYTKIFNKLLDGIEVKLKVDYFSQKEYFDEMADKVLYTGPLDQFYNYSEGVLEYRSLRFEHEIKDMSNFQGNAVVNYTDVETPYTRILEHKHFEMVETNKTVITKEYSIDWTLGIEPYYPINDNANQIIYDKYKKLSDKEPKHLFGGRLAEYKYYDMHIIVERVLELVNKEFPNE
ncbi:UDP-galactopyranose mutase [Acholeplasma oculi]|uniref:UDP-galactopyranose mutase n=1 Tax=Acholeplasma oculi TaxID=35623 RepID=A0A061AHN9_9MOLU|nr:UDP-galactopyranose mutase [Acholeplasma oculi]CDR30492.1 UDP-galactopyranose mutase [Acholeplasma oculi]SKC48040.1 UDP-galactopyranose mutase [Acholeplasma oculi]SUT89123.1 UDP-galactopyranose mutase [Acholeplasma oculi]